MNKLEFPLLTKEEIEVKVSTCSAKGSTWLLYKDVRCDQNQLDNHPDIGPLNWGRDHKELKGVLYGAISIYDKEKGFWVSKWDAGVPSFAEGEKGEASDSIKRSGFNWGIGRELYSSPFIFIPFNAIPTKDKGNNKYTLQNGFTKLQVSYIEYDENRHISKLVLAINEWGNLTEIYRYPKGDTTKVTTPVKKVEQPKVTPVQTEKPIPEQQKEDKVNTPPEGNSNDGGILKLLKTKALDNFVVGDFKTIRWMTEEEFKYLMKHDNITDIKEVMDHFYEPRDNGLGINKNTGEALRSHIAGLRDGNSQAKEQATGDITEAEMAAAKEQIDKENAAYNEEDIDDLPF